MYPMKHILITGACAIALAGCAATTGFEPKGETIVITGSASGPADAAQPVPLPRNPAVDVYPVTGAFDNPMGADRSHSVLDNTTRGGYTVFDESVKVYPLPGDDVPAFMPDYAVPPLEGQYKAPAPMVGSAPMGLASAGTLPPVPNVDLQAADPYATPPVSGAVKQPMVLASPEPLAMQPPAEARPPLPSPFASAAKAQPVMDEAPAAPSGGKPAIPVEEADKALQALVDNPSAIMSPATAPAPEVVTPSYPSAAPSPANTRQNTMPGRRSVPLLTGY